MVKKNNVKTLYILPHPIQYQTPLINYLSANGIDIIVGYKSNISSKSFYDDGFQKKIKWGKNILKGHNYFFNKDSNNIFSYIFNQKIIKIILSNKEIKFIWVHGSKNIFNILIILISKLLNKKVFLREENTLESKKRNFINIFLNKFFYFLINPLIDQYLAIGKKNYKYYVFNNINKKKIRFVPYVVDNNFFSSDNFIKKTYKDINFLFVGKFHKNKGIRLLLEAFKEIGSKNKKILNKIKLTLVGNGILFNEIKKYILNEKLKFIKLTNFQSQKKLKYIYQKSDILILPSLYEPWGLVINEALNAGNAIICSDKVGAAGDLVINNKNGFVFKSNDKKSLIKSITKYLKNEKMINSHKKRGKQIINKYNFKICCENIKKITTKLK